jgi:hypothetical protein
VRPQLLDILHTRNCASNRDFTEFGGRNGHDVSAFLPTGETALFLLAGNDLGRRLTWRALFDPEHVFARHNIIRQVGTVLLQTGGRASGLER